MWRPLLADPPTGTVSTSCNQRVQLSIGTQHNYHQSLLVACLPYSLTLKMEAMRSSKMSVKFYQTKWRHIPGDSTRPRDSLYVYVNRNEPIIFVSTYKI
jgi:hypothetical protein